MTIELKVQIDVPTNASAYHGKRGAERLAKHVARLLNWCAYEDADVEGTGLINSDLGQITVKPL